MIYDINSLGICDLNAMQQDMLQVVRRSDNVVLLSPTGSGKTLAYLLPVIEQMSDVAGSSAPEVLVLVPSRELAIQTMGVAQRLCRDARTVAVYGGRPAMEEHRTMKGIQPSVIIGTPGRMNDHLSKQNFDASTVRTLIIDEFDKCLEFGFQEEMATVIGQLPKLERRFLLSATDSEEIPQFTGMNRTTKLSFLNEEEQLSERIHIYKVMSPIKDKLETLYKLLCTLGAQSTLVFCNHRESVERVGKYLQSQKFPCGIFHGGMEQEDRERSLYKFRNGSCHVLISTDLAARGLDIPDIENIVHYHMPIQEDGYIHRNGRTARWEAEGNSYIILHGEEVLPAYIQDDPEIFTLPEVTPKPSQPEFVTLYIGKGKKDKINKIDIVGFLSKKGQLNKEEVGRIDVKDHYSFAAISRKKVRQTLALGVKTIIEEAQ